MCHFFTKIDNNSLYGGLSSCFHYVENTNVSFFYRCSNMYVQTMREELHSSSDRNERRVKDIFYFKRFQHYGTAFVRGFNIHIRGIKIPRMIPHIKLFRKRRKNLRY